MTVLGWIGLVVAVLCYVGFIARWVEGLDIGEWARVFCLFMMSLFGLLFLYLVSYFGLWLLHLIDYREEEITSEETLPIVEVIQVETSPISD